METVDFVSMNRILIISNLGFVQAKKPKMINVIKSVITKRATMITLDVEVLGATINKLATHTVLTMAFEIHYHVALWKIVNTMETIVILLRMKEITIFVNNIEAWHVRLLRSVTVPVI